MKLTTAQLLRAVPQTNRTRAEEFVKVFNEWAPQFGIDTPLRIAHFLAQCWLESGCLQYLEEIASGKAYEWRKDLGNVQKGDGVRFKGRGIIQITGRANYQAYARSGFCVGDLMSHPEWLAKSPGAYKSAMWFWWRSHLSELADADNGHNSNEVCRRITRKVNGGTNELASRQYYMRRFKKELGL